MDFELKLVEYCDATMLWRNPDLEKTNRDILHGQTKFTPVKCKKIFETSTWSDIMRDDHIRVYQDKNDKLALLTICEYYPPFSRNTASWYSNEKCFAYKNIYILRERYTPQKNMARNITYALEECYDGTWEVEILIDNDHAGWIPFLYRSWVCQECKAKEEALLTANLNSACYDIIDVRNSTETLQDRIETYDRRFTPEHIRSLEPDEVFVFGSNIGGMHGGGAAAFAHRHFGAQWGVGEGLTGQCYALPTMEGGVDYIQEKVNAFLSYASMHCEKTFLVTPIACGIAGFTPEEIAPLFRDAISMNNVILPKIFVDIIVG